MTQPGRMSTSSVSERLQELRHILEHLPTSLPESPASSQFQAFVAFAVDPDDVEWIGSVDGAVNRALEVAFGAEARSKGVLPIEERGPAICGLVDALEVYQRACARPESDALLVKWIDDIRAGAERAYKLANEEVSTLNSRRYLAARANRVSNIQ